MKRGNRMNARRRIGNDSQRGGRKRTMFTGRREGGNSRSYRGRNAGFRDAGRRRGGNGSGYRGRGRGAAVRDNNRRRIPIRKRLGKRKPMNAEQLDNDLDNYHKKQGEGNKKKDVKLRNNNYFL